jgi:hypothetical protein
MPTIRTTVTTAIVGFAIMFAQTATADPPRGPHDHPGDRHEDSHPGHAPPPPPLHAVERPAPPGSPARYEQLKRAEAHGVLSPSDQVELARMEQGRRQFTYAERQARLEDLRRREAKLAAHERMEYERLQEARRRHEELDRLEAERERNRLERIREAKRRAWEEQRHHRMDTTSYAEYQKHAQRQAKLDRVRQLAAADGELRLVARIDALIAHENQRHNNWIARH